MGNITHKHLRNSYRCTDGFFVYGVGVGSSVPRGVRVLQRGPAGGDVAVVRRFAQGLGIGIANRR